MKIILSSIMIYFISCRLVYSYFRHCKSINHQTIASRMCAATTRSKTLVSKSSVNTEWDAASEGMTLVIVESPAKAKTIQSFLDPTRFLVDYSAGHIRDLPESSKGVMDKYKKLSVLPCIKLNAGHLGIDVFNDFEPLYVPLPRKEEVIRRLSSQAKKCSRILLASDEDREGEAIAWHLRETLEPAVPTKRAVFHEITKHAILDSFANPRDIDMNLVHSQETRRILDRLAGFTISPLLWRYIAYGLSAGRVQSCGLSQIAKRERLRWAFKESQYFSVLATFMSSQSSDVITARLSSIDGKKVANENDFDSSTGALRISSNAIVLDSEYTDNVMRWLGGVTAEPVYELISVDVKKVTRRSPVPFITSTLQQEASKKLGFSPSRTMSIAQSLYEEGFITYMRTDSPQLGETARNIAKQLAIDMFGQEYLPKPSSSLSVGMEDKVISKSKKSSDVSDGKKSSSRAPLNAQEAHEAIRPAERSGTFLHPRDTGLEDAQLMLYSLVYRRTLASVMAPAISQTTTYVIEGRDDRGTVPFHSVLLRASSTRCLFKGFLAALESDQRAPSLFDEVKYNEIKKGEKLHLAAEERSTVDENIDSLAVHDDEETLSEVLQSDDNLIHSDFPGLRGVRHITRPPSRYSEASFIKELEAIGVGRPSTYSKILSLLRDRDYIIVDKQTIVPTVKGLIVVKLLEKHFPELVEPEFTASMERMLDMIAHGEQDKLEFLTSFYLGEMGLLSKIASKMENQEFDHKECRSLDMPMLAELGKLKLGSQGVYLEKMEDEDKSDAAESKLLRWLLPEEMQLDIRRISRESVEHIMSTEMNTGGLLKGTDPVSGKPVTLRSGRFGRYGQIGADDDKTKRYLSLPHWFDGTSSLEDLLDFATLPKTMCMHPELNAEVIIEVSSKLLSVGVKGFPLRVPLPYGMLPSQATAEICLETLPSSDEIVASNRALGNLDGVELTIQKGRFGHYVRCGSTIAGLGKLDPLEITFDEAITLIETKRKRDASGKGRGKRGAKTKIKKPKATNKVKPPRSRSAYHVYVSEAVKGGAKLGAAAVAWKNLSDEQKAVYFEKVEESNQFPDASLEPSLKGKLSRRGKADVSLSSKNLHNIKSKTPPHLDILKTSSVKPGRKLSGYKLFIIESVKGGKSLTESASLWKGLEDTIKQKYIDSALQVQQELSPASISSENFAATKKKKTIYHMYISDAIKSGMKLGEAASRWKGLNQTEKSLIRDKFQSVITPAVTF